MNDPCPTCGAYRHPFYEVLRKKDEELGEAARKISALRALLKEKEQT